jgi:hypothetical protein
MPGCAFGPCGDPVCPMCVLLPQRFPPIVRCARKVKVKDRKIRCRYVEGHKGRCDPSRTDKPETHVARDGDPKLAGERKREPLMFQKRQRKGPLWVPPDRRV